MFIYRDYRWRDLPVLLHRTLRTVAMVLTLIACASSVGYIMALTQMPAKMTAFFLSISDNKYVILFLINILLLLLGTLVDMAPSILIATPILLPVMANFGVDPGQFGLSCCSISASGCATRRSGLSSSSAARSPKSPSNRSCARSGHSMR